MKSISYINDNLDIFPGFYESCLYNSDTLWMHETLLNDDGESEEIDIDNWEEYTNEVAEHAVMLLKDHIVNEDGIFHECKLDRLQSPTYYNYSTDKLVIDLMVDKDKLRAYLMDECREEFDRYLCVKYSSRSGFWSFVSNNIADYFENSNNFDDYTNVAIDYYILSKIYDDKNVVRCMGECEFTPYMDKLMEYNDKILFNHIIVVDKDK